MMTAFYSFRLVFVTFWGDSRVDHHHAAHVHEPSRTITMPLIVLAILAIVAGYLGIPGFLAPVFPSEENGDGHHGAAGLGIMLVATLMGLTGIAAAYFVYVKSPGLPDRLAQQWRRLYDLSFHKWYVDEAYDRSFVRPTFAAAAGLWKRVDVAVIDGAVNGVAQVIRAGGSALRLFQSGQTQHYALGMAFGAMVILTVYLLI